MPLLQCRQPALPARRATPCGPHRQCICTTRVSHKVASDIPAPRRGDASAELIAKSVTDLTLVCHWRQCADSQRRPANLAYPAHPSTIPSATGSTLIASGLTSIPGTAPTQTRKRVRMIRSRDRSVCRRPPCPHLELPPPRPRWLLAHPFPEFTHELLCWVFWWVLWGFLRGSHKRFPK